MPTASSSDETYARLIADAESASGLVGLFVLGSRGRGVGVDSASDYDVAVIFEDEASAAEFDKRWPHRHGAEVEVLTGTLDGLRDHASFGTASEWARYQYAHVDVLIDRTGDELVRILEEKETIPDELRDQIARDALGAYLNSTYRALRYGTQLDAAESVPSLLTAMFALEGRVRPFNKYLVWELEHHPLQRWTIAPQQIAAVLNGDAIAQHEVFREVESVVRLAGLGDEIDAWEPDLDWLRGFAPYRR